MGNGSIQVGPTIFRGLDNTIYALRSRLVENTLPPSEIPNFGDGHNTFDLLWYAHKGYADGSYSWDGARQVGSDWVFNQIVPGSSGRIYAVEGMATCCGTTTWDGRMARFAGQAREI
jgi:hypothetical protein